MHRYLVVANQTLGDQKLLDVINDRIARGPAEFWILVPATPTTHLNADFGALSGAFPVDSDVLPTAAEVHDEGIAVAKSNLETELRRLREIGATADGAVGDSDPMKAIERTVAEQRFDEIILSTMPPGRLPLARMGPATSYSAQNARSADSSHYAQVAQALVGGPGHG